MQSKQKPALYKYYLVLKVNFKAKTAPNKKLRPLLLLQVLKDYEPKVVFSRFDAGFTV